MSSGPVEHITQHIQGDRGGVGGQSSTGSGGPGGFGDGPHFAYGIVGNVNVFANADTQDKVKAWLHPADVSQNQRAAEDQHYAPTGTWFEETEEFKQWKSTSASPLWLHGISGCGKTILSSTIIRKLRDDGKTIAYFYFDTTDDRKQKLKDLLCTLIWRLWDSGSHVAAVVESFWKSHANGAESPSNPTLLEILKKILHRFTAAVYIICDALDESSEVDLVLDAINSIVNANIDNVHVFLTSRSNITYGNELFSTATAFSLTGPRVAQDIKSYLDHFLATDGKCKYWSNNIKNDVCKALLNGPDPMFRLVALLLPTAFPASRGNRPLGQYKNVERTFCLDLGCIFEHKY
ncbi:Arp, Ankyrin repeat protein [Mycena sanguinolenta]|uniref:Arp, Ankyrin repeat protein n=1 Tax=Mycena sanguinolenta TaxID=230812 RepID=A0A8H6ZG78_9AGAR|nr:Arp, Ankyrin repeat protein [Mycena sanguinolenta]